MTKHGLVTQLKTFLIAQTWTGSSNVVFPSGSVIVTTYAEVDDVMQVLGTPFAIIIVGDGTSDSLWGEEPDLLTVNITVRIGTVTPGETLGENPLMGANRADSTLSEGAGLYQIEQEVYNAIGRLNAQDGIIIQHRQTGMAQAIVTEDRRYIAVQDLKFEGVCTITGADANPSTFSSAVVQASNQTESTGTLTDITNLSFSVSAGVSYHFKFSLIFSSDTSTIGLKASVTIPSATTFSADARIPIAVDGVSAEFQGWITSSGDAVTGTAVPTTGTTYLAIIEGMLTPSASGTLQAQFAAETSGGTVTLYSGSSGLMESIG